MKTKLQSKTDEVRSLLEVDSFISRNWALQHYISRLSDIIYRLKKEGYKFDTTFKETKSKFGSGRDYLYYVKKYPTK